MIKKSKLTFFDKLVLWVNYLLVALLLLSYLAPYIDPRKAWFIAFLGLGYPPLLLVSLLFVVYWLLRKSKWALLSLISILLGWNVLSNTIGFRASSVAPAAPDSSHLRVMTYNVHNFKKYGAKNDISTKHEILEIITHEQPDVIGFEEFYSRKRGQYDMVDSIKRMLHTPYYYFAQFQEGGNENIGMAIFSKYQIIDSGIVWLNEQQNLNQCIYINILKNQDTLRVYAIHLQSISFEPQDYQYLDSVSKKGKADINSSRRIGGKLKLAFVKRSSQVAIAKKHMSGCPYPYIVMGDFNDTPSSFAVNQMAKGLKNTFREKGSGLGRTYNGDFPNYQIDYIMTSQQFDVLTYRVIRKKLSDHFPVYSDLRLR